jgi:hypothetical protein
MGAWSSAPLVLTRTYLEVRCRPYDLTYQPPVKRPHVHCLKGWIGLKTSIDVMREKCLGLAENRTPNSLDKLVRSLVMASVETRSGKFKMEAWA